MRMSRKHCGKGENAAYQHFLLCPYCFQKLLYQGCESRDCVVKGLKSKLASVEGRIQEVILVSTPNIGFDIHLLGILYFKLMLPPFNPSPNKPWLAPLAKGQRAIVMAW